MDLFAEGFEAIVAPAIEDLGKEMKQGFGNVTRRFDFVEHGLGNMEDRLKRVEIRLDGVEQKLDKVVDEHNNYRKRIKQLGSKRVLA